VPAYLPIEKISIAEKYLIPKFKGEYGFDAKTSFDDINVTRAALIKIVNNYCQHEAGVRNLRKCIDRIFRKVVAKIEGKKIAESAVQTVLDDKN
jgi:ATP-dependent Lon protease